MGMYESRGQLSKAMKELLHRWLETKAGWSDAQSREFEERFIIALEQDLKSALAAMDHMNTILTSARRECSE